MKQVIRKPDMTPVKTPAARQDAKQRIGNDREVELGYTPEQAMAEAARCMNCPGRYCERGCPVHTPVPDFTAKVRQGAFEEAYQLIAAVNPQPAVSGRVCPQECQCEQNCTRGIKGQPVAIGRLERFVADWHAEHICCSDERSPDNGKRAAVVGAGPAGLTFAETLVKAGYEVTVLEASNRLGGTPEWGIPTFVLPGEVKLARIARLKNLGVTFRTGMALGRDYTVHSLKEAYDAVFLGIGAMEPVALSVEGASLPGVVQANAYLSEADRYTGENVVVIGGGDTAVDAARTAVRQGAASVKLLYRRTEAEMPARLEDLTLAREEGVAVITLVSPTRFTADSEGRLAGVVCDEMELTAPDYPAGRKNTTPTGKTTQVPADLAILALGFRNVAVDGITVDEHSRILVDGAGRTSLPGVYAGGDAVTGPSTVMKAAAGGALAAGSVLAAQA